MGSIGFPPGVFGTPPINPNAGGGGGAPSFGGINAQTLLLTGANMLNRILNRPRSGLGKAQRRALNSLIAMLQSRINQPVRIDPTARAQLFNQIAQTSRGAEVRGINALVRRGVANSGITADFLGDVTRETQRGQNTVDIALLNEAFGRRTTDINQLLSSLGLASSVPQGQSVLGAGTQGLFEILVYTNRLQQRLREAGVDIP